MVRSSQKEKLALKKGPWSCEEDRNLIAYIKKYGIWNWTHMPKFAGLSRSGKSCRLRWMNYLRPDVKLGNFTEEEDQTIISMHEKLGSRWSAIAKQLPGRSDNQIKNHWHTRLKKRLLAKNDVVNPRTKLQAGDELSITYEESIQENSHGSNNSKEIAKDTLEKSINQPPTPTSSGGDWDFGVDNSLSEMIIGDFDQIFWTQPFLTENSSMEGQPSGLHSQEFDPLLGFPEPLSPSSSFLYDDYCDSILFNYSEKEDSSCLVGSDFQFNTPRNALL